MAKAEFTKTQQMVMDKLSDGRPHSITELMESCHHQAKITAVQMHISRIRSKLRLKGIDIVCLNEGNMQYRRQRYQMVRLMCDAYGE